VSDAPETPKKAAIDPETARKVAGLTLEIRRAVDGALSGKHRSPHRGASVVFVEHREYRPGDDPRLIDWRAYARNDRHAIKRFEQETQLKGTLLLDVSRSMAFPEGELAPGQHTKLEHAAALLAGLALVLRRQSDAMGLIRFARDVEQTLPARASTAHVERVLEDLALPVTDAKGTGLAAALTEAHTRSGRRGLVVLASDLLDLEGEPLALVAQLVARGHDVWVLQVLTKEELELPGEGAARYLGLEGEPPIEAEPTLVRDAYRREIDAFLARCRTATTGSGARYRLVRTDEPIEAVLAELCSTGRAATASPGRGTRWG
jgi:uncharacterized protein (DUF58 family)